MNCLFEITGGVVWVCMYVSKDIGYWVGKEECERLFVSGWQDVISELRCGTSFLDTLKKFALESKWDIQNFDYFYFNSLLGSFESFWRAGELLRRYMDEECFRGVLLQIPPLRIASRRDNVIDAYEVTFGSFDVRLLNRPIFPVEGYVFTGKPLPERISETIAALSALHGGEGYFRKGTRVSVTQLNAIGFALGGEVVDGAWYINALSTGSFKPNADYLVYLVAKAAGILKEGLEFSEFNLFVNPAIVSYWS